MEREREGRGKGKLTQVSHRNGEQNTTPFYFTNFPEHITINFVENVCQILESRGSVHSIPTKQDTKGKKLSLVRFIEVVDSEKLLRKIEEIARWFSEIKPWSTLTHRRGGRVWVRLFGLWSPTPYLGVCTTLVIHGFAQSKNMITHSSRQLLDLP
ncbi:hypothetical protein TSUD_359780 [Trifolium subterraneum]|uniref:Uncharacterized protein n=1 Tax=Trifolium subterraneum TaxID=3900 RepID=A0A2Z6MMP8_TRISU|nr:hypothetical protein TSUD_359780 [Trifolium subterraneum]